MRMVDEDRYCIDVMRQISAISAALERVSKIELKNHFEHCYADAIRSGDGPGLRPRSWSCSA
jgi:DNA-binding FrmR family transcriptional regulator